MSRYDYNEDEDDYVYSHLSMRKRNANGKHIPNKNEATLLRRLMSQTGMTEEEIRSIKMYRVMLSREQKRKGFKTPAERAKLNLLKRVTHKLKLAKEHPLVKLEFNRLLRIIHSHKDAWSYRLEYELVQPMEISEEDMIKFKDKAGG